MISDFDQPASKRTVFRGLIVVGCAQGVKVVAQIGTVVVLSRILDPSDFGVVAMVAPMIALVSMFQDLGLQQAMIQARSISSEQMNRLFWLNLLVSAGLALVLVGSGPLAAWFFGDPRVSQLTAAYALPLIIQALSSQHIGLLNRNLRFAATAWIDVVFSITSLLSGIVAALILQNYWAIWAATTCAAIASTILAWVLSRWVPGNPFRNAETGHLLAFGFNIAGFNLLNFFSRNMDNLIIAKLFGAVWLGYYDRAYKLLTAPLSNINGPISRVVLPILGRLQDDPMRYRTAFMSAILFVSCVCVPGITALGAISDRFVLALLGDRWAPTATIFMWLAISGVCQPIGNALGWLFVTQNRTREFLAWGLVGAGINITSFGIGAFWGAVGVAAAYAIATLFVTVPLLAYWAGRKGPVSIADIWMVQGSMIASSAIAVTFIRFFIVPAVSSTWITIGLSLTVSYAVAATTVLMVPDFRRLILPTVKQMISRLFGRVCDNTNDL